MPVSPDHPPVVIRQLRWGLVFLLAGGLGWACTLRAQDVVDLKEKPLREFYQDFRGSRSLNSSLKLIGPEIDAVIKQEDLGLRITLPKDRPVNHPVEVMTLFSLVGDVEITGRYELLSADQPAKGYGVGVTLSLATNETRDKFAAVARAMLVNEGSVYGTWYWRNDPTVYKTSSVKTETRAGQLRLVRVGSKMHFLVADGAGNDFREIKQHEFVTDNLEHVRFAVTDGYSPGNAVDARLVDLRIRASKFSPDPVAAAGPATDGPVKSADRGWLMAALLIGAAIVMFVCGAAAAALFLRRRRPAVQTPAGNQPAASKAASAIVAVACGGCGTKLKAKAEWAGKTVKCPQCGKAVAIPAAKASDA